MTSTAALEVGATGSGDSDHYSLKAGDLDPELNKRIKDLVLSTEDFIVYLADDLSVQWRTADSHVQASHCGDILSQAAILEAQSQFIENQAILGPIRRQIAEAIAHCFADQPVSGSLRLLDEARRQLVARNKEIAWSWYFTSAYFVGALCVFIFYGLWTWREVAVGIWGQVAVEVVLGALCGPLGAILSTTSRANGLVLDANAGKAILRLEGLSRVGAGFIGAAFVAMTLKSGMLLGGVNFPGSKLAFMLAFCIAAGSSERIIPSLVVAFEKSPFDLGTQGKNDGQEK